MLALALRAAPAWVDRSLRIITRAGGATATLAASLILFAVPATRHLGLVTAVANLFSHLLVQGLKRTVVRARPSALLPGVSALVNLPDHYSFPSGHACAAMAVALPVLFHSPMIGAIALAVAFAVAASRVYLRVHYMTDVVVGQMLGVASAVLAEVSLS